MSDAVMDALVAAGILSNAERCSRVVIDLQAGNPAVIHARYFGDSRLLDVIESLDGIKVVDVAAPEQRGQVVVTFDVANADEEFVRMIRKLRPTPPSPTRNE